MESIGIDISISDEVNWRRSVSIAYYVIQANREPCEMGTISRVIHPFNQNQYVKERDTVLQMIRLGHPESKILIEADSHIYDEAVRRTSFVEVTILHPEYK